ncbi:hypothetical protein [Alkalinema sp. FACHB-956]|uniref:hypothetical protein n=1 Tax=Alkalinema sp. FACHB-956 TaxID=2692768 RepID=UPI001685A306|nr:hypothetical protein [Alkalinema sp. FACHB-956]MBD2329965.1 hypothetical protein [Alkalinema sp. FACHB-956]
MILLDILVFGLVCFFSLLFGIFLSGVFGEEAPALLRIILGLMGLSVPPVIVWSLRNHSYWNRIRLGLIALLTGMIVVRCAILKPGNMNKAQRGTQTPTQEVSISQKASLLKMGMTYRDVVAALGQTPDTVINNQIRQEIGEPIQENNLITFEWKNDNPDCHPISAQFNPLDLTLTGWNEGKTCTGPSSFNKPSGKSCAETTLCDLK